MNVSGLVKVNNNFLQQMLKAAQLGGTPGPGVTPLSDCYLALWTAWSGFVAGIDASKITEATYTGYARIKLAFGAVSLDSNGRVSAVAPSALFKATGTAVSEGIKGFALFDSLTGGNLLGVGNLPTEFTFASPTDQLSIVVTVSCPGPALTDWGNVVAIR